MSPGTRWILIIVGLLVGNVVMMGVLVAASTSSRPAIIPGYYDRAVAYNGELEAAAVSRQLGWQVSATLEAGHLTVTARDVTGAPIRGARVRVIGVPRARASARFEIALAEAPEVRRYIGSHAGPSGLHDLEVHLDRGGDHFLARLVVEAR